MLLKQLHLIVSALTCSISAICAYLFQLPIFKMVALLGFLWSIYACYKIFRFDYNKEAVSKVLEKKEELKSLNAETVSQSEAEALLSNPIPQTILNEEKIAGLKKEPTISKPVKRQSNT
jgi:hypothetical protein